MFLEGKGRVGSKSGASEGTQPLPSKAQLQLQNMKCLSVFSASVLIEKLPHLHSPSTESPLDYAVQRAVFSVKNLLDSSSGPKRIGSW